jgi:hypothetical protein
MQNCSIQELSVDEIDQISGGAVTTSGVLAVGAAIAGAGAIALAVGASPILAGGAVAYGAVSGTMALAAAVVALYE